MAKKEKQKDEEDLTKLKLPPIPQPESKTENAEKIEEAEVIEEVKGGSKEEASTEKGNKQMGWTPKDVEALIRLGMEFFGTNLADKWLTYKKNDAESRRHI